MLDDPPDHETDIASGWTLEEPSLDDSNIPVIRATFASFANHNVGDSCVLRYRSFESGVGGDGPFQIDAHLYQEVAGAHRNKYVLTASFRLEDNYSSLDVMAPTQTILAVEFRDGGA